jgi:hypothetical protein
MQQRKSLFSIVVLIVVFARIGSSLAVGVIHDKRIGQITLVAATVVVVIIRVEIVSFFLHLFKPRRCLGTTLFLGECVGARLCQCRRIIFITTGLFVIIVGGNRGSRGFPRIELLLGAAATQSQRARRCQPLDADDILSHTLAAVGCTQFGKSALATQLKIHSTHSWLDCGVVCEREAPTMKQSSINPRKRSYNLIVVPNAADAEEHDGAIAEWRLRDAEHLPDADDDEDTDAEDDESLLEDASSNRARDDDYDCAWFDEDESGEDSGSDDVEEQALIAWK